MKIKDFSSFLRSRVHENSDMDFSMQTWGEVGQDSHPPNSGFEGTSGEPMDYSAGYTGEEEDDESVIIDDASKKKDSQKKDSSIEEIKAKIEDLEKRINSLEPEKEVETEETESATTPPVA